MTHYEEPPRIVTDDELAALYKSYPLGDGDKARIEEEIHKAYPPLVAPEDQGSADTGDAPSQSPATGA